MPGRRRGRIYLVKSDDTRRAGLHPLPPLLWREVVEQLPIQFDHGLVGKDDATRRRPLCVHLTHPLLSNGCELQRLVFPEFGNYDGIVWVVLNRLNTWTRGLHRFVNWSPPLLRNTGSVSPSTSDCKNMRMIPARARRNKKMNTPIVIGWKIMKRSGENLTPVHLHCAFRVHVRKLQILCCHFDRLIRRVANVELKLHVAGRGIYQGRLTMAFFFATCTGKLRCTLVGGTGFTLISQSFSH